MATKRKVKDTRAKEIAAARKRLAAINAANWKRLKPVIEELSRLLG